MDSRVPTDLTTLSTEPAPAPEENNPKARRAARAAFLGFAVDYFDIYLPVVALAPAIGYFQPPGLSPVGQTTLFYLTFAVTLIGRPIGSIIFGGISDRLGRRKATLIAVAGFTAATFLMATLPGYREWGLWAIGCLLALRLIGGIFMGGEYTSANPLALEASPKERRGIVGAVIGSAYPVGYIAISLVTLPLLAYLPHAGVDSPYQQWGWRIPFVVGGLLGVAFFVYFHRSIEESEVWQRDSDQRAASATTRSPLSILLKDPVSRRRLAQTTLLMSGLWFAVQSIISPTTGLLIKDLRQDANEVTTALLLANIALFFGYLGYGVLGQRFGRRRVLLVSGLATLVVSTLTYAGMIDLLREGGQFPLAMALYTVCLVVAISPFGVATVYLLEVFPTAVRASGYGFAYSVSLVIPSFYSLYMVGLAEAMPYVYTPVVLIALGGVLTLLGARLGRETNSVELSSPAA